MLDTPLLQSIQRLRHAARHVRHRHLLTLGSFWGMLSTIANICNVVYAVMSLSLGEAAVPGAGRIFLATAVFLDWVTLLQYFRYNGNYFLCLRTFKLSGPEIFRTMVGTVPIFIAFACFATATFGSLTERFDGIAWSCITFFAVANGDIVRESFQMSLYGETTWFGQAVAQLVMYVYCCLFIYVILRTTMAINQESYLIVRPLPRDYTPGARTEDIATDRGKMLADRVPTAYRLPKRARRLLSAMQAVRDAGGAVGPVVLAAAKSMPFRGASTCAVLSHWLFDHWACFGCCRRAHHHHGHSGSHHHHHHHHHSGGSHWHSSGAGGDKERESDDHMNIMGLEEEERSLFSRQGSSSRGSLQKACCFSAGLFCRRIFSCCSCCDRCAQGSLRVPRGGSDGYYGQGGAGGAGAGLGKGKHSSHANGSIDLHSYSQQSHGHHHHHHHHNSSSSSGAAGGISSSHSATGYQPPAVGLGVGAASSGSLRSSGPAVPLGTAASASKVRLVSSASAAAEDRKRSISSGMVAEK